MNKISLFLLLLLPLTTKAVDTYFVSWNRDTLVYKCPYSFITYGGGVLTPRYCDGKNWELYDDSWTTDGYNKLRECYKTIYNMLNDWNPETAFHLKMEPGITGLGGGCEMLINGDIMQNVWSTIF